MEAIIDINLLEEGEENPFEKIVVYAERALLNGRITEYTRDSIMKKALAVERTVQDLVEVEVGSEWQSAITGAVMKYASEISILAEGDYNKQSMFALDTGIDALMGTLKDANEKTVKEIETKFNALSFTKYLKRKNKSKVTREELSKAVTVTASTYAMLHSASKLTPQVILDAFGKNYIDEWDINFNFKTNKFENHLPLDFLYQFAEIINKIEGATVILEKIEVGTIKAKLKVLFEDAKSKQEVKDILESSKKFAKAKLERDFDESEKIKAEREKIEVEKDILKEQLKQNTSIETDYKRALEISSMEEDLESKKLANLRAKMQLLKESREMFSEMLAEGYLSQKDFEMMIKGIPFLKIENGVLKLGESTDVIDGM